MATRDDTKMKERILALSTIILGIMFLLILLVFRDLRVYAFLPIILELHLISLALLLITNKHIEKIIIKVKKE